MLGQLTFILPVRGSRMEQPNRFQKLVAQAKWNVTEISAVEARKQAEAGEAVLIDVREESDWREGHAEGTTHLSRGVIELEIEGQIPDVTKPIICYCGGGSRSVLVAESLQKMGYENVRSLAGGLRAWKEAGLPMERE
jgi:rhodanese-related sulfurtransferase